MVDRQLRWHYDFLDIPFADLRRAGAAIGGTLNDAFLGGLSGGLRRYHDDLGAPVDQLRVTMPISIRTDLDGPGGNHITLVRFEAPVGIENPHDRMREIHDLCIGAREESAIPYSNQIAAVLNLLPVRVAGDMLKHVDLLASNVPGFDGEVFIAGARIDAFYAFGPTTGAAANVTLMSYNGTCHIGITTDAGAVPDAAAFTAALDAGFAEVIAAAG
jgi:diacylglycerol O-acyltransferase